MAPFTLPEDLRGISGPLTLSPEPAKPLLFLVETQLRGPNTRASAEPAHVSDKLKALLRIARKVQQSGRNVTPIRVARARQQGATHLHDTVLIAGAFSTYNRYVDGLATWQPQEKETYVGMGKMLAQAGYARDRFKESAAR